MGRPNKTTGSPVVYSRGISLSKEQENRLLDLLGIDVDEPDDGVDVGIILINIKTYLGAYEGLPSATDNAPRPVNYICEIGDPSGEYGEKKGLVYDANNFLQTLCKTSYWIQEIYKSVGYDIHSIERELGRFIDASSKVVQNLKRSDVESRGRPEKQALRIVINHLNDVFEKYHSTPAIDGDCLSDDERYDARKKTGKEQDRENFISECLGMASIPCPDSWRRLIYSETDSPEKRVYLSQTG